MSLSIVKSRRTPILKCDGTAMDSKLIHGEVHSLPSLVPKGHVEILWKRRLRIEHAFDACVLKGKHRPREG